MLSDSQIIEPNIKPAILPVDSLRSQSRIFIWLRKFFNPNIVQASAVIADQCFCSIVNFLTGVLVARACPKAEYGIFIIGLTILNFMTGLQNSLVSVPYTIQYPRCEVDNRSAYLGSTLIHQIILCVLTATGFFVVSFVCYLAKTDRALVSTMFMLSVASFAFMIREFIRLIMLAELKVWLNLAMSFVANITTITTMIIAYRTKILNSPNAYLIITFCSGIPAVIVTGIYWKKIVLIKSRILQDFKSNFKLGKWLMARSFANIGAVSIYPIILASFHGTAEVGVYGACFQLASLLNPLFMGMNSFLRPKFSHLATENQEHVNAIVFKVTGVLFVLLSTLFTVMLFVGDWVIGSLYGAEYSGYKHILLVTIIAVGISVLSGPLSILIDSRKQTIITFKGSLLGAFFSMSLGLVLVYMMGSFGAGLGLLFSYLVSGLYWYFSSWRTTE